MRFSSNNYRKIRMLHSSFYIPGILRAIALITILLINSTILKAQDRQYRLYYQNILNLNDQWRIKSISGIWLGSTWLDWLRIELRSGGYYKRNRNIELFAALRIQQTITSDGNQMEVRPFQGVHIIWPRIKHLQFRQRFIIEERFLWSKITDEFNIYNRFRYRAETSIPLNNSYITDNTCYLRPMAEIFINMATTDEFVKITSGKVGMAFGYRFTQKYAAEFRYEFQSSQNGTDESERDNAHLFRLRFIHTLFRN